METNIVTIADTPRISLGVALNILIVRKVCPDVCYHVAIPTDSSIGSEVAKSVIQNFATSIYDIPAPKMLVDEKPYRIENKINALRYFGEKRAILVDSDVFFIKTLPMDFVFREVPAAVPEHSPMDLPWDRIYRNVNLILPTIRVLCGGGSTCEPWFNAGFVSCPNAAVFGEIWWMMAQFVANATWIPERFPYTDQISLPLTIAQLSPDRTVGEASVLPSRFNQNMFYWAEDQGYLTNGFVAHHHNRVGLIRKYFPRVIMWIADGFPEIELVLREMSVHDQPG